LQTGTSQLEISALTVEAATFVNSSVISLTDISRKQVALSVAAAFPTATVTNKRMTAPLPAPTKQTAPEPAVVRHTPSVTKMAIDVRAQPTSTSTPEPSRCWSASREDEEEGAGTTQGPRELNKPWRNGGGAGGSSGGSGSSSGGGGGLRLEEMRKMSVEVLDDLNSIRSGATSSFSGDTGFEENNPTREQPAPDRIERTVKGVPPPVAVRSPAHTGAAGAVEATADFNTAPGRRISLLPHQSSGSNLRRTVLKDQKEHPMVQFDKGKHVMLSYQWKHKKTVVAVEKLLREKHFIPTWIDIENMGKNVYDSMAEGVQGAAAMVCFMSNEYKDSRNCQLEAKFAQQAGVPIIPVKYDGEWVATGWLGLITAGGLWISLDGDELEAKVHEIAEMILLNTGADSSSSVRSSELTDDEREGDDDLLFSVDDVREELSRLNSEMAPEQSRAATGTDSSSNTGSDLTQTRLAPLPAVVPADPLGFQVTDEMKRVREFMLAPDGPRQVGVCGMGGSGKTVVTAWMSRLPEIRGMFKQICWVRCTFLARNLDSRMPLVPCACSLEAILHACDQWHSSRMSTFLPVHTVNRVQPLKVIFGQTPNLAKCQSVLYMQLTGAELKDEMAPDERWQALKTAMNGKTILLVLDDAWEPDHITDFNFIDETTSSRVLISSRVRELLEHSTIIDLKLPSEANSVEILLHAADHKCAKGAEPPEAVEVVRFCNSLPLALGIAGRLLRSMALGVGESWTGVVAMLKDEFKGEHGEARAMENSVIRTSLKSIKGKDKMAITNLFLAFALIPEDTACPLDIIEMMYCSTQQTTLDRADVKPPNRFQIRKWLKVLINRSLVLGSVDRPQLHDIVLEFVLSSNSREWLQSAHRRLLETFISKRPAGIGGWDPWNVGAGSIYICQESQFHIKMGVLSDWKNDELLLKLIDEVYGVQLDALQKAACDHVGFKNLIELANDAKADGDQWKNVIRSFGAFNNRMSTEGVSGELTALLTRAIAACKLVRDDHPTSISGLRPAMEYVLYFRYFQAGAYDDFQAAYSIMQRLMKDYTHTDFAYYTGELMPLVSLCTQMFPAFQTGLRSTIGKLFVIVQNDIQSYIDKDIGRAAERRLKSIKFGLYAPVFCDIMRCHTMDAKIFPTKEEVNQAFAAYDHSTDHTIVLEIFGQNLMVCTPLVPYHLLVRFLEVGEAEFALVEIYNYFLDMCKLERGIDMFTVFAGAIFWSVRTLF
jgi:hypothetical protein